MLKRKLLILLIMFCSFAGYGQITPQWKSVTAGLMSYFYSGKSPAGYDTLWNAQTIRGYVSAHAATYNFLNGLTKDVSNNVSFGGSLADYTNLNLNGYNLTFSGTTGTYFALQDNGQFSLVAQDIPVPGYTAGYVYGNIGSISVGARTPSHQVVLNFNPLTNGVVFNDDLNQGIKYGWTDDSSLGDSALVPKRYVTSAISSAITAATPTATGGVIKAGNDFRLGSGTLANNISVDAGGKAWLLGDVSSQTGVFAYQPGLGVILTGVGGGFTAGFQQNSGVVTIFNQQLSSSKSNNITFATGDIIVQDNIKHRGISNDATITHSAMIGSSLVDKALLDSTAKAKADSVNIAHGGVSDTTALARKTGNSQITNQRYLTNGTAGNGYYDMLSQSVSPLSTTGHLKLYSDSLNRLSWKNSNYRRTIRVTRPIDLTISMPYRQNPTVSDSTDNITLRQQYSGVKLFGDSTLNRTLYLYGTSILATYGYNSTWFYSDNYGYKLSKLLNYNFVNNGQSGQTLQSNTAGDNSIYAKLASIPQYTPGSILGLEVGINDATASDTITYNVGTYTTQLNNYINTAKTVKGWPANKIWVYTAFYWSLGSSTRANAYIAANASISSSQGTLYYDGYNTYKSSVIGGTYVLAGGLHPDQPTHTVFSGNMFSTVFGSTAINNSANVVQVSQSLSVNGNANISNANITSQTVSTQFLNIARTSGGDIVGEIPVRGANGYQVPLLPGAVGTTIIGQGTASPPIFSPNLSLSGTLGVTGLTTLSNTVNVTGSISGLANSNVRALIVTPTINFAQNGAVGSGAYFGPSSTPGSGFLTATLTTPGTGYTNGTYTNVPLVNITGSGSGALATVVITSNSISSVTVSGGGGTGYAIGNTFTFAAGFDGGTSTNFVATIATIGYSNNFLSSATFVNAPITLQSISAPTGTPPNGSIWQTANHFMGQLNGSPLQLDLPVFTSGLVPFAGSTGVLTSSSNFNWNNTNFWLGLGATANGRLTLGNGNTSNTRPQMNFQDNTNSTTNGAIFSLAVSANDLATGTVANDMVFRNGSGKWWWAIGGTPQMSLSAAGALNPKSLSTTIIPASLYQASTGTTSDSLRFASSQKMVQKALVQGNGITLTQTLTALTIAGNPAGLIIGTPTITAGAGAGTSPTVSVTSNGRGLQVTVTTGSLPTGTNATVATVTLANALSFTPYPVFSSGNANTALLNGASMIYMTSSGASNLTITSGTTALTAATTYVWNITL